MSRWSYGREDGDRLVVRDADNTVSVVASTPIAPGDLDGENEAVVVFNLSPSDARDMAQWLEIYARAAEQSRADPEDLVPVPDLALALARAGVTLRRRDQEYILMFGVPDPDARKAGEPWLAQLLTWQANGTFARLNAAMDSKQPVQIRRSDGSMSVGHVCSMGFGGRAIQVQIKTPKGPLFKNCSTEDFLELNPGFGPHLKELTR